MRRQLLRPFLILGGISSFFSFKHFRFSPELAADDSSRRRFRDGSGWIRPAPWALYLHIHHQSKAKFSSPTFLYESLPFKDLKIHSSIEKLPCAKVNSFNSNYKSSACTLSSLKGLNEFHIQTKHLRNRVAFQPQPQPQVFFSYS